MRATNGRQDIPQATRQAKYFVNDNQSLVCFAAGGAASPNLARRIAWECDPASKLKGISESEWELAVHRIASTETLPYPVPIDDLLIIRADVTDAFWLVSRRIVGQNVIFASILKLLKRHHCTGANTDALFLPRHLWTENRSVEELKRLAVLTLSYAAQEQPQSVGPPFDIMTLDKSGHITWTEHRPRSEKFQAGIERLFEKEC
jgi:hypothetical protein